MVSNVYLHFFDESRLWNDVVQSGWSDTEWYVLVRSGMGLYEMVRDGTEWYGVVRGGPML